MNDRVTYRDGAFYVEPINRNVALSDAADGLARAFTPFIAFADRAIESFRADWTEETKSQILLHASRSIIADFDDGIYLRGASEDDLRRELVETLADAVVLQSRLMAAKLGGI